MQTKSWIILRVLLNRHQKAPEKLLQFLPPDDAKGIASINVPSDKAELVLTQPSESIKRIHYSWLLPALKTIPKVLLDSTLTILPKIDAEKLRLLLKQPKSDREIGSLAPCIQTFLINTLFSHVKPSHILPLEYLQTTPLTPLIQLKKNQLMDLIDLLGIYDLADEVRGLIDKERLRKIYACLKPKQRTFLRTCLHQKEQVSATRLKLDTWNGDCAQLDKILHGRGLIRLAKALSGQHPDFIWHLTHILDSGRGSRLLSHYSETAVPNITQALTQQVLNLLNIVNTKS